MRSNKSWFNSSVLWKDLRRFWPAWALYSLILGLWMINCCTDGSVFGYYGASRQTDTILLGSVAGIPYLMLPYGFVVGQILFRYLYDTRQTVSLHAMPLRREGWLLTHGAAGLVMGVIPAFAVTVLGAGAGWSTRLTWALLVSLNFLFYFGLSTLASQLAGTMLGGCAMYAVMCGGLWLSDGSLSRLLDLVLPGYGWGNTPLVLLARFFLPVVEYDRATGLTWGPAVRLAVLGILALAGAMLLYRSRKLEQAGSFFARCRLSSLVKLWCVFLGAYPIYLIFTLMMDTISDGIAYFLALFISCFGVEMLSASSIHVFHRKNWLRFGACFLAVCLLAGSAMLGETSFDLWGPKKSFTEQVTVSCGPDVLDIPVEQAIQIQRQIHRQCSSRKWIGFEDIQEAPAEQETVYVGFRYRGKIDSYWSFAIPVGEAELSDPNSIAAMLEPIVNSPEACVKRLMDDFSVEQFRTFYLGGYAMKGKTGNLPCEVPQEELFDALVLDAREGNICLSDSVVTQTDSNASTVLARVYLRLDDRIYDAIMDNAWADFEGDFEIPSEKLWGQEERGIPVTPRATHTVALLRSVGVID